MSTTHTYTNLFSLQIIGIELRPMPSFSLEILPGTKVKLRASCTPMRRGVAMLSQECIVLLDGSVERLVAYTSTSGGACISAGSAHALQLPLQKSLPSAVGVNHPPFNQSHLIDPIQVRKFQQQQQQQQHQQQQQQQRPQIEVEKSLHRPLHEYQRLNPYSAPEHEYDSSTASRRNATVESNGERHQMDATVEHQSHNEITAHSRPLDNTIGSIRSVLISPGQPTTADILDLCSPSSPPPSSPRRVKIKPLPIPIRGMSLSATQGDFYGDLNGTTSPSTPSQGITMRNANIKAALAVNAVHTLPAIMKTSISNIKNGDAISAAGVSSYSGDQSRTECQSLSASALTYFALDVVAAWLSGLVGSQASCTLPAGDFAVRGTAVNIRKFKVVPSEGYVVLLSLEEEIEAKGENESKAIACVPALVSNKLCSKYLQTTAKEYLLNLKEASKEEIRAIKTSYSLKFRDFRGTFRARLQPCNSNSKISQSDPAVLDAQTGKSCSASSQGDRMLLLLVDFYCSEVT